MALFLDLSTNDIMHFADGTKITLERKSGTRARLRIEGPGKVELVKGGRDQPDLKPVFRDEYGRVA